jgi:hypothetical protein
MKGDFQFMRGCSRGFFTVDIQLIYSKTQCWKNYSSQCQYVLVGKKSDVEKINRNHILYELDISQIPPPPPPGGGVYQGALFPQAAGPLSGFQLAAHFSLLNNATTEYMLQIKLSDN